MARLRYAMNSFSLGVMSEKVQGNTELEGYNNALKTCENFLVQHTGGLFKRGGSKYEGRLNADSRGYLFPFSYNVDQTYICVVSDGEITFYTREGSLIDSNGFEVAVDSQGFTWQEFSRFSQYQTGNILYVVTNKGLYMLERITPTNFSFAKAPPFTAEPMDFVNTADIVLIPESDGNTTDSGAPNVFPVMARKASNIAEPAIKQALCFKALYEAEGTAAVAATPEKTKELDTKAGKLAAHLEKEDMRLINDEGLMQQALQSIGGDADADSLALAEVQRISEALNKDCQPSVKEEVLYEVECEYYSGRGR